MKIRSLKCALVLSACGLIGGCVSYPRQSTVTTPAVQSTVPIGTTGPYPAAPFPAAPAPCNNCGPTPGAPVPVPGQPMPVPPPPVVIPSR
jgi:hypothetical protein